MSEQPLNGIRVLDFSRLLPGSYATMLLANLGAEVIKVEMPGGEPGRGMKRLFELTNSSKKSVTLDLKSPRGQPVLGALLDSADVVFESFRPGVAARLGMGYSDIAAEHPELVYCSLTGYGQFGPYAARPGHDLNYLAVAGAVAPRSDGVYSLSSFPPVDMMAGMWSANAICAALLGVRSSGRGRYLDVSMTDVAFSMNCIGVAYSQQPAIPGADAAGESEMGPGLDTVRDFDGYRWPDLLLGEMPAYGVFETSDGVPVSLCNIEDKFWRSLVQAVGLPEFEDDRFAVGDRGEEVREALGRGLRSRPFEHWTRTFEDGDICFARVNTALTALEDVYFIERRAREARAQEVNIGGPSSLFPVYEVEALRSAAPGEHNRDVYGSLGFGSEAIDELAAARVV
ncbi:CoA transferase [Streptomyces sp. NPDC001982]|uniref:CaiB/BaiF CoA transferase family protein n=1 Tax=Streptomyces sp. NPDC001982 TaxID=3154405 RepID=UPI00331C9CD9